MTPAELRPRRGAVRRRLAAVVLAAAALGGCALGGIPAEELPASPIAVGYRDAEQARQRAELLAKPEQQRRPRAGVARVKDVQRALGATDPASLVQEQAARLALVDPTSAAVEILENAPRGAEPYSWSPDRTQLSFVLTVDGAAQVHVLDRTSGEVRRLTHGGSGHGHGALGPDGRAAWTRAETVDGQSVLRIWATGPRLASPRAVSPGPSDRTPAWAPDGRALVYVGRGADGVDVIQRVDAAGGEPQMLARGRDPVFSPDGQWIVYSARTGSGQRLWKMRPDGSGRLPLGQGSTEVDDEIRPAVSPDGRFVAYVGEAQHRQVLRVRRMDGTGDRILLEDGDGASPAW